ncbi:hypothetical protein AMAG_07981 [Allomyces macrogynus ATCC 38327]|uniref:Uncharacterized protein n=1 Tax=Allomyces macrogynus (strain ATCC 38327) TaxID=578462 RepID=A0A0L0SK51_ALLM3|nr:hypothetical protein AMAG_07981 [Allomyces macrogynus ATCC 38327]|eukprot:KNE62799.1 hypothetical protein AMAG_07981 [Allomyces macrogynus ATCC 38327]
MPKGPSAGAGSGGTLPGQRADDHGNISTYGEQKHATDDTVERIQAQGHPTEVPESTSMTPAAGSGDVDTASTSMTPAAGSGDMDTASTTRS